MGPSLTLLGIIVTSSNSIGRINRCYELMLQVRTTPIMRSKYLEVSNACLFCGQADSRSHRILDCTGLPVQRHILSSETIETLRNNWAGGRNRTRPGGRNRTRNVRSSFTTGGRNRTRMCQKRDRRGTLERVETEREGVKTERGVHFLWQAQACGSVTCKEIKYFLNFQANPCKNDPI